MTGSPAPCPHDERTCRIESAVAAIKAGAYDFLEKPLHMEVLLDKVESALKHRPAGRGTVLPSDTRLEIVSADLSVPPGVVDVWIP